MPPEHIGHQIHGKGPVRVIAMHDWFSDCSSYNSVLPYLDMTQLTCAFADLRGYGRSKSIKGIFSLEEALGDILELANHLQWPEFHLVGHSMSGMIAQYIALKATSRVKSVIAITPVPASGLPAPAPILQFLEDAARQNDESARQIVNFMTSGRYAESRYPDIKVQKWRESSTEEARIGYLKMFGESNFAEEAKGLSTPFLVIAGACDNEAHLEAALRETMLSWYPNAKLTVFQESGHYPMQEEPVLLASTLAAFLRP
ncbi:MAG: alpha/beta hydrolase [Parachlamydia sp.]|nr:alpha/beta hydrolase [Parachlamydia sp.]